MFAKMKALQLLLWFYFKKAVLSQGARLKRGLARAREFLKHRKGSPVSPNGLRVAGVPDDPGLVD